MAVGAGAAAGAAETTEEEREVRVDVDIDARAKAVARAFAEGVMEAASGVADGGGLRAAGEQASSEMSRADD